MILKEYIIPLSNLKEGIYEFDFQADDLFFQQYENPEIYGGSIQIHVILHRNNTFLELDFQITGTLKIMCDRCLETFDYNINTSENLYVRFGEHFEEINDNVIIIPENAFRLDISQYIYEFSALSIPLKKVHPDEGNQRCDPEMIKLLKDHSGEITEINPVWEKLRDILN